MNRELLLSVTPDIILRFFLLQLKGWTAMKITFAVGYGEEGTSCFDHSLYVLNNYFYHEEPAYHVSAFQKF